MLSFFNQKYHGKTEQCRKWGSGPEESEMSEHCWARGTHPDDPEEIGRWWGRAAQVQDPDTEDCRATGTPA